MNTATVDYLVVGEDSVGYIVHALIQSGLVDRVSVTYSTSWRDGKEEAYIEWVDKYDEKQIAASGNAIVFVGSSIVNVPASNLRTKLNKRKG